MKRPIKNIIDVNHETLGYIGNNVLMQVENDHNDIGVFTGIYDFDLLYKAMDIVKKQYPPLKPETKNNKPDYKKIEFRFMLCNGGNHAVLMFRVLSKTGKMIPEEKNNWIALAPIVTSDNFKNCFVEYDEKNGVI